ncbi:MAG: GGDEF domain-containing protein [Clostridiales bacterium]|nr:GGDEF domain-containing protein [Clostridiales bacterium]
MKQSAVLNESFMSIQLGKDILATELAADLRAKQKDMDLDIWMEYLSDIASEYGFDYMGYVTADGTVYQLECNDQGYKKMHIGDFSPESQELFQKGGIDVLHRGIPMRYSIAYPIVRDGITEGSVYMSSYPEKLAKMVSWHNIGDEAFSCFVRVGGEVVFSSGSMREDGLDPKNLSELGLQADKLEKAMCMEYTALSECVIEGEDYLVCAIPLSLNNWYMVSLAPKSSAAGNLQFVYISVLVSGLVVIFLLFLLLYHFFSMRNSMKQMRKLAYFDKLTGVYNQDGFLLCAPGMLRQNEGMKALLLIDIVNFEFINELFGFAGGDKLLIHVAKILKKELGAGELYFRDTTNRFGALMRYKEYGELQQRIHRILDEIVDYSFGEGEQYHVVCRCGVRLLASGEERCADIGQELNHALMALQEAQESPDSRVIFYNNSLYHKSERRHMIESRMEAALQNGQFHVVLQPKFILHDHRIAGAEALVRWEDEEGQTIYHPEEFIPIMEQNGFIARIDQFVLREACRIIDSWGKQGISGCTISVNQSRRLLYQRDYVESLKKILREWNIPAGKIILEITESVAMENTELLCGMVDAVHQAGCLVSMDDFGSGYSSLNVLKDIPVDELKLDRVFFEKTKLMTRQKTVIRGMIALAKSLQIKTVAEGIETVDQEKLLSRIGCDMAQSFYFSGCLRVDEFTGLLIKEN